MFIITLPNELRSSQRLDLDADGIEYLLEFKWVPTYQRFYLSVYDARGLEIIKGIKLIPGAPINMAKVVSNGPQGLFVIQGNGDPEKSSFSSGTHILYYLDRKITRFPLDRQYTIDTDTNQFLLLSLIKNTLL